MSADFGVQNNDTKKYLNIKRDELIARVPQLESELLSYIAGFENNLNM